MKRGKDNREIETFFCQVNVNSHYQGVQREVGTARLTCTVVASSSWRQAGAWSTRVSCWYIISGDEIRERERGREY